MTSRPTSSGARLLWPLAALLSLAGVVLLALGAVGTAGRASADLVGVNNGDQVSVGTQGLSVWSRTPQTREEATCTLGNTVLLRPVEDFSTTVAGTPFYEVARTPDDQGAGTFALSCSTDEAVYAGPFGPATVATGIMGGTGLTLGLVLLPLGLVLAILAWSAGRRRARSAPQGPDPSTYTLSPAQPGSWSSPYAAPTGTMPPPAPGTAHPQPPSPQQGPPPPGQPQVSPGPRPAPESPPAGPRYDLPPPS